MDSYDVIKRPIVTEKATRSKELSNEYAFQVAKTASKPAIKRAVEELFKVKVLRVRTIRVRGKPKRVGGTFRYTRTSDWKKAYVALRKGDKIEFFEGA